VSSHIIRLSKNSIRFFAIGEFVYAGDDERDTLCRLNYRVEVTPPIQLQQQADHIFSEGGRRIFRVGLPGATLNPSRDWRTLTIVIVAGSSSDGLMLHQPREA
jgi:hypothetical protein